jgi:Flp pilus assembly pilin Flp
MIKRLWQDEEGQSTTEYMLILFIIVTAIVAFGKRFRTKIEELVEKVFFPGGLMRDFYQKPCRVLRALWQDENGQTATEYTVLLALMAIGFIRIFNEMKNAIIEGIGDGGSGGGTTPSGLAGELGKSLRTGEKFQ